MDNKGELFRGKGFSIPQPALPDDIVFQSPWNPRPGSSASGFVSGARYSNNKSRVPPPFCYNEAMGSFRSTLRGVLPAHLSGILDWDFIPFEHIENRHRDLSTAHLTALFEAYIRLDQVLDIESLASAQIPEDSWGCMRCGFCCTDMRPGPVKASTYHEWERVGSPLAFFYSSRGTNTRKPVYRCWFSEGTRLRICPFMFTNRNDLRPFCSLYNMGDDLRPSACAKFIPRHKTCTQRQIDLEPWEIC